MSDRALLAELRDLWAAADPVSADLVPRVLFTLRLDDLEVELAHLREVVEPAGARGADRPMITFTAPSLTVMVAAADADIDRRRLDGWLAPPAALRVELRSGPVGGAVRPDEVRPDDVRWAGADADGRFSFDDVPAGLIQLRVHPTDGAAVVLDLPVVTPAVQV
jgi:hypothetical protein